MPQPLPKLPVQKLAVWLWGAYGRPSPDSRLTVLGGLREPRWGWGILEKQSTWESSLPRKAVGGQAVPLCRLGLIRSGEAGRIGEG